MTLDARPTAAEPFELEIITQMPEQEYVAWMTLRLKSGRPVRGRVYKWGLTLLAVLCFVTWRTVALGVVLGVVAIAVWTAPKWMAASARHTYRQSPHLHGPLIYGVSSRGIWFRGGNVRADCNWDAVRIWGEHGGHLWLAGTGIPNVIFPIDSLRRAGVYERVRALAEQHAALYNSPAAARLGRAAT